jgi:hypothetical protein
MNDMPPEPFTGPRKSLRGIGGGLVDRYFDEQEREVEVFAESFGWSVIKLGFRGMMSRVWAYYADHIYNILK